MKMTMSFLETCLLANQRGREFLNADCATLLDNPFLALSVWQNKRVRW
jgi:hypothetical protein